MPWVKQKVVVPIDFSDESIAAIDVAREIATTADQIHLVHVLPDLVPVDPSDDAWQTLNDESRIKQALLDMSQRLADEKYAAMPRKVLIGDPGHSLTNYARELGADLIVMPSHGRTGLARMLIGSVAERVLRLAHCPVLVLCKDRT
jgi:nucleotide-binding universal stress UspA family protein